MSIPDQHLSFKPVQFDTHTDLCIQFRADSFVVSFGDADKFYETDGKGSERYIEWLKAKFAKDPNSVVHIWKADQIIGQIELGRLREQPDCGYVNLYYLVEAERGRGYGLALDDYSTRYFKNLGLQKVKLSVSPTNGRALSFYKKLGWIDTGPRPDHPEVHFMEKSI